MKEIWDIIVVGAGHAGLSISYLLNQHNIDHIVLEQGNVGHSWKTQRWDSFAMVTPNKVNILPGHESAGSPEDYMRALHFSTELEKYAKMNNLPVRSGCKITSVTKGKDNFILTINDDPGSVMFCRQLVIASGSQNRPVIPPFSKNIFPDIYQIHSSQYRNASILPKGNILVVGSGQSGIQISSDLVNAGRNVILSTSQAGRIPRNYRGLDIIDWFVKTGFYDHIPFSDNDNNGEAVAIQPQISTSDKKELADNYYLLHEHGVRLIGDIEGPIDDQGSLIKVNPNLQSNMSYAKNYYDKIKLMVDNYIVDHKLEIQLPNEDHSHSILLSNLPECSKLDLIQDKISTIIWATGFDGDFAYLKLPVFENGKLKHKEGVSTIAGLFFIGLPWMRKRKSGIIWGIREDAAYIVEKILSNQ